MNVVAIPFRIGWCFYGGGNDRRPASMYLIQQYSIICEHSIARGNNQDCRPRYYSFVLEWFRDIDFFFLVCSA